MIIRISLLSLFFLALSCPAQKVIELKQAVTAAQFKQIYLKAVEPCLQHYKLKTLPKMQKRIKELPEKLKRCKQKAAKAKAGSQARAKFTLQYKTLENEQKALHLKHKVFAIFQKELMANAEKDYKLHQKWLKMRIKIENEYKKLTKQTINFFAEYQRDTKKFITLPQEKESDED